MNSKYIKEDKLLILELLEEIDHHGAEKIRRKADDEITKYMPRKVPKGTGIFEKIFKNPRPF